MTMTDKIHVTDFEVTDYLNSEEDIAEYLTAAAEDPDPEVLIRALSDVARARGMAKTARDAGCGRESLHKTLSPGSKPQYATVMKIMKALGVRFNVCSVYRDEGRKSSGRTKAARVRKAV